MLTGLGVETAQPILLSWRDIATTLFILDERGNIIGYREGDYWDKEKINVFNKKGTKIGYYKKNYYSGNWEYHDEL
mgnify:CR=1 FL=1